MAENYIFEIDNALSDEMCDNIIHLYELNYKLHRDGQIFAGVNKNVKNTRDMLIPKNNDIWKNIEKTLYVSLHEGLNKYLDSIQKDEYSIGKNTPFKMFAGFELTIDYFMIQKYEKNDGKYIYHNDYRCDISNSKYRVITYIFYLNDVIEGGETEFWATHRITPKKGKVVFFPSTWSYPHCGKMPISSDKYIITGWFYCPVP
jgi:hypothetical protein